MRNWTTGNLNHTLKILDFALIHHRNRNKIISSYWSIILTILLVLKIYLIKLEI
jgi:hypothetical protein